MQKYGTIIYTGPLTPLGGPVPYSLFGRMAELVDALDSKSCDLRVVRVQVPSRPPDAFLEELHWSEMILKGSLHLKVTLF